MVYRWLRAACICNFYYEPRRFGKFLKARTVFFWKSGNRLFSSWLRKCILYDCERETNNITEVPRTKRRKWKIKRQCNNVQAYILGALLFFNFIYLRKRSKDPLKCHRKIYYFQAWPSSYFISIEFETKNNILPRINS